MEIQKFEKLPTGSVILKMALQSTLKDQPASANYLSWKKCKLGLVKPAAIDATG